MKTKHFVKQMKLEFLGIEVITLKQVNWEKNFPINVSPKPRGIKQEIDNDWIRRMLTEIIIFIILKFSSVHF